MAAKKGYQEPRNAFDIIPGDEDDPPVQRSNVKTKKPAKAKKIFSYKMEQEVGERLWEYWRAQTRGRTIGEIAQEAFTEYLERVGG